MLNPDGDDYCNATSSVLILYERPSLGALIIIIVYFRGVDTKRFVQVMDFFLNVTTN